MVNDDVVIEARDADSVSRVQPMEEANSISPTAQAPEGNLENASSSGTAWIGALKKESRKKGFEEGYHRAQEEFKRVLLEKEEIPSQTMAPTNNIPSPLTTPTSTSTHATPSDQSPETSVNPQLMEAAVKAAQEAAEQANMNTHFTQIAQRGAAKYPDYNEKIGNYIQLAQDHNQKNDPELGALMALAAQVGNEDLVYKIASDENFRNEIITTNPRLWHQKLVETNVYSGQPRSFNENIAAPPISNLPKHSSYGSINKLSSAEKRLRQKKLFRS